MTYLIYLIYLVEMYFLNSVYISFVETKYKLNGKVVVIFLAQGPLL